MSKLKKIINWDLKDIIKVLFGSLLFCASINIFIVPNNLYNGGVLGFSQLVRSITMDIFGLKNIIDFSGILYYLINIPLFVIAYKNVSKTFFARTLIAVTIQALLLTIIPVPKEAIVDDLLVCVIIGGIIAGAGAGITLSCGASTGGTDIIGLAVAKKNNKYSVGKLGMIINIFIFLISGILYGVEIMIYSIIYTAIDGFTVDKMHEQNICSTAFILCKKNPKVINDFIKNELNRDYTYWDAKGGYDDSKTYIIYTVLSKYELIRLEKFMKNFDGHAFMVKSEGVGVKGEFEKNF